MQTFILLCFEKEAVLYFVKDGAAKECRYRGNDTLSLDWNKTQFEEMWLYYTDVQDIEDWADVEILAFCLDKKTTAIWDKLAYPISEQVSSINIQNFSVLLPHLAKAQNLLAGGETTLAWREFAWKITENSCEVLEDNTTVKKLKDKDFIELIVKYLTAQKNTSKNLVALEADKKHIENLKNELNQNKAEYDRQLQELQTTYQNEKKALLAQNEETKKQYNDVIQTEVNKNLSYTQFLNSGEIALIHPNYQEEYIKKGQILEWMEACEKEFDIALGTTAVRYQYPTSKGFSQYNFPDCPVSEVQGLHSNTYSFLEKYKRGRFNGSDIKHDYNQLKKIADEFRENLLVKIYIANKYRLI